MTVALTSTANDQLQQFALGFKSIKLTSKSGNTVTLLSSSTEQPSEFIHLNGGVEPFTTVTIQQDVYTSAAITIGGAEFTCVTLTPDGGLDTSTFAYGYTPDSNVTVKVPSPITVTGSSMALSLDLQVSQSATWSACYDPSGFYTFSITPTFNLTSATFSSLPTNPGNGLVTGLNGTITTIDEANSRLTLSLPEPNIENARTLSAGSAANTVYQGIGDFPALAAGMFVNVDGGIQPDGSLSAKRMAVVDASAIDVSTGPAMSIVPYTPGGPEILGYFFSRLSEGQDPMPLAWVYRVDGALFQISGQLDNLQTLPFIPSFGLSNIVAGQNVYVSSQHLIIQGGSYTPATTITLMPQTVNGTVTASSSSGNFTDYTVSLTSDDLFPALAAQPGQLSVLNNPNQVEVYVDSNTQLLNRQPLGLGSTFRFYGLVFNDNATLRMDCVQVNDGVPQTQSPRTRQRHLEKGGMMQIGPHRIGPVRHTVIKH